MRRLRLMLAGIDLIRALVVLGALILAINIASAIWDVRMERGHVGLVAQREFSNLTRLLAEQTAATLDGVDLLLRDSMRRDGSGGTRASAVASIPRLREEAVHARNVAAFVVMDRDGAVVARTADTPGLAPDAASRAYFTVHRDASHDTLHVSDPFQGGDGGRWWFVMSRRLERADGRFDGVLAAVIDAQSFDRLYRSIDLRPGAFITLASLQGVIISRTPDPMQARGRQFPGPEIQQGLVSAGRFDGWTYSPILGEKVMVSAVGVRGFPLVVVSGGPDREVFAPWRDHAEAMGVRTLLTSLAMALLIALATWGLGRRERALARSEKLFRAMIENSHDAVLLTRPGEEGILYASPAFERITGYSAAELRGRDVSELLHPDHLPAALERREELVRAPGRTLASEAMILHRDGSPRWIESTLTSLRDEPGIRAVVMNFRDITERKHAETERKRLEQRLRQAEKMEAVGRLAGGIAHDFNNILGGILGYAEMLAESSPEGSPQKRYANNVLTAANRASALVEQILSYSRSQRGKREPVDIGRVVGESLELVRGTLPASIRLEAGLAENLCVVGDATRIHQVVMNLCTNAIHAMGERGGRLKVLLEREDVAMERELSHTQLREGAYVRLRVEDEGSGMDRATLDRIFEPFFTTKEVGKGTGLGLSLVYGIVADHEGAIHVESAPGRGTAFTVWLPRVDAPLLGEAAPQEAAARGRGERILVVDDEEAILAVTCEILRRLGYEPAAFGDASRALAEFERAPQDCAAVITDEVMPGMSGTELARRLSGRRPGLPVLLMSGYIGPVLSERAAAAGVSGVLRKPLHARDLARALDRALHVPA